jgi:hypothetical protein
LNENDGMEVQWTHISRHAAPAAKGIGCFRHRPQKSPCENAPG